MYLRKLPIFLLLFLLLLFFPQKIFATSPQITAYPNGDISLDQSFTVSATMSGLSKSAIYRLRIVLASSGTSNYFGSTWNGADWYSGNPSSINYANFYSITTDANGAWSGDVQGKIDPDDPNFTAGSGTYDLKVGRYTQTGSTATWSNIVSVNVVIPPTPIPTSTPSPTNTSAPTAKPTSTPTKIPTVKPTTSLTSKPTDDISTDDESSMEGVLGTSSGSTQTPEKKSLVAGASDKQQSRVNWLPIIFILAGFGLLASCGILIFFQSEKGQILWKRLSRRKA